MTNHQDAIARVRTTIDLAKENAATGELPFAHAEVTALRAAWRAAGPARVNGAVLVTSCEPCALCLSAAALAGIGRTFYAATRDDVYGLGNEEGSDHDTLMRTMADALRAVPATELIHVPSADARAPFAAWIHQGTDKA